MRNVLMPVLLLSAMTLAAGCGAQPGRSLVKYDDKTSPRMTEAPTNGMYALYAEYAANPDVIYPLKKGAALGFAQDGDHMAAVGGDHHDSLQPGKVYYWKLQDE